MMVRIGGLIASALVILGSFVPWASVEAFGMSDTMNGFDGDGRTSLVIGLVMALLFGIAKRGTVIAAAVVSLLALGLGAFEFIDLQSVSDEFGGIASVSPGIGLFMIVAGGIAGTLIGVFGQARLSAAPTAPAGYAAAPFSQAPQGQAAWGQPQQPAQGQAWGQPQQAAQSQAWGQPQQAQAPAWGQQQVAQPQPTPQVAQPAPAAQPQPPAGTPAGWLADPYRQAQLRYWDGARWTEHTHNHPQG